MRWLRIMFCLPALAGLAVCGWCAGVMEPELLFLDETRLAVSLSFTAHDLASADLDQALLQEFQKPKEDLFVLRPDGVLQDGATKGSQLQSVMPVSPWLKTLEWPPVLLIHPQIQKGLDVKEWRFAVMDSARRVLYSLQGKGSMPETIVWNGKGQNGEMVDVGLSFFYTLGAVDNGGNPIFMTSPSQQLQAFAFVEQKRLVLYLLESLLFLPGKNVLLSTEGERLLKECADEIARRPSPALEITAVSRDAKLGELQARVVGDYFLRQLTLPPGRVSVRSRTADRRFKIEIVCK